MEASCTTDIRRARALLAGSGCGPKGPKGDTGEPPATGNLLHVDAVYGNDTKALASPNRIPFLTIEAALTAVSTGQSILIYPGTYNLSAGITIPDNSSIIGIQQHNVIVQMQNVTNDTTLLTMGENTVVENITFNLTSTGHHTLKGVIFSGTTTSTAKIYGCSITVDNSTAAFDDITGSTVIGIEAAGTGESEFDHECIFLCIIKVISNGAGTKRGLLVSNTNTLTAHDSTIYVTTPTNTLSTGSYVGVETNDSAEMGSVNLHLVSVSGPAGTGSFTSSDILQTTPTTVTSSEGPGIEIGPGTEMVTKTAGARALSTFSYRTVIFYGLKGTITSAPAGYLWVGTQAISAGNFPDTGTPAAYYRIERKSILGGMAGSLNAAPGGSNSVTITIYRTPIAGGGIASTIYTMVFNASDTEQSFYDGSVDFLAGDFIHAHVDYVTGSGGANAAHDLTLQLFLI